MLVSDRRAPTVAAPRPLTNTCAASHFHLADHIVVLSREGKIAQQGSFDELRNQDGYLNSLLVSTSRDTDEATTTTKPAPRKKPVIKGVSQNDVTDLTRKTGDMAVYKHYFKSIGWPNTIGFLGCTALFVFALFFPREP